MQTHQTIWEAELLWVRIVFSRPTKYSTGHACQVIRKTEIVCGTKCTHVAQHRYT